MGVAAAIGIGTVAVGAYGAYQSGEAADDAASAASAASDAQYALGMEQINFSKEQWKTYKEKVMPLELEASKLGVSAQELALKRGKSDYAMYESFYKPLAKSTIKEVNKGPNYAKAERLARQDVNQAFDTAEGSMQRNLERRGASPTDGAYTNGVGDMSLKRAAVTSSTINDARDREYQNNLSNKFTLMGLSPNGSSANQNVGASVSPNGAAYSMAQGANTMGNVANNQWGMAQGYGDNAAGAISGGINLGMQAFDLYNKFSTPSAATTTFTPTSTNGVNAVSAPSNASTWGYQPTAFGEGGPVETPRLTRTDGGMVSGPPGYDQVPAAIHGNDGRQYPAVLTHGEYVIPKNVVDSVGRDWLDEVVDKYNSNEPRTTSARLRRGG